MNKLSFKNLFLILTLMTAFSNTACSSKSNDYVYPDSLIVVAHRGGAALGIENSLSCIQKGIESGADMIEIDVHLTADGHVVVCHDRTIDRTTNGKGRIEELTLEQIRQYRLLNADGTPSDETIPTLEEVFQTVNGRCDILLEIKKRKDQYKGIEQKVTDLIRKYNIENQMVIQSFNDYVLAEMHRIMPSIRLEKLSFLPPINLDRNDYISSFNVYYLFASRRFVNRSHKHGKEVKLWTVNSRNRASRMPVDGIITNDPQLFLN